MKITTLGNTLSVFFVISFILCVLWGVVTPMTMQMGEHSVNLHMHQVWAPLLPGFHWSLIGVLIGIAWAYFWGWYISILFVLLYKFFNKGSTA